MKIIKSFIQLKEIYLNFVIILLFQILFEIPHLSYYFQMIFYFVLYNLKMKSFLLVIAIFVIVTSNLVNLNPQCPQQSVPDINKMCIKPLYIQGCTIYKSTLQCSICSEQYQLNNGKCSIIDEFSTNPVAQVGCLQISSSTSGQCINCANGYRRVDGKCQIGERFCEEYADDGTCNRCNIEYSLIFGECKHNFLLGCKVQQSDHTCAQCHKPFQLANYQCIIKDCKSYNDFGCYSCECGFYVTEQRSCQKIQEGCLKYNRGVCSQCQPHYKLKGGSCTIQGCLQYNSQFCSLCKTDYDLIDGVCVFKNCLDWQDDSCRTCNSGFNLIRGHCVQNEGKFVCSG